MNRDEKNNPKLNVEEAAAALRQQMPDVKTMEEASARVWQKIAQDAPLVSPVVEKIRGCQDVQALLPAYQRSALERGRELVVTDHLRECTDCQKANRKLAGRGVSTPWSEKIPAYSGSFDFRRFATAAVLLLVMGATTALVYRNFFAAPEGARARVESVQGAVLLIAANTDRPILAGAELQEGDVIRTGEGAHAMVKLADGSLVEMNQRTQFSVRATRRDTTVEMGHGHIIVQASKRSSGHLYVSSPEYRVAVTGTVFAVNAGMKGARVSVIEGEVQVEHNGQEDVLHAGDQTTTSDSIGKVDVREEIAWSRNLDEHVALLAEFSVLGKKLENVATPQNRYQSGIINFVPADSVMYASIPNYGESLKQANQLFQEQLAQSAVLREWWEKQGSRKGKPTFDEMVNRIYTLSQFVGNEVVFAANIGGGPQPKAPIIIAEVKRPGLREFLDQQVEQVVARDERRAQDLRVVDDAALATLTNNGKYELTILVREDFVVASPDAEMLREFVRGVAAGGTRFTSTGLGQVVAGAYQQGAGIVISADLGTITSQASHQSRNQQHEANWQRSGLAEMRYLLATRREVNGGTDNRMVVSFNGERRGIASWLAAPAPMATLDFVSPSASAAASITVKNPAAMMDDILALTHDSERARRDFAEANAKLNIHIKEDLAATLGGEFTLALDGPVLPTPSWKAIGEVLDQSRLQSTIGTLVQSVNAELAKEKKPGSLTLAQADEGGRTFYVITANHQAGTSQVHYTFVDGYIVLAPSRVLVTQAIQTRESGVTLSRSQVFTDLMPRDGHTNFSGMIYQNLGSIADTVARELNPNTAQKLQTIAANARPTLLCAYGDRDSVEFASTGMAGVDFNNLAILDVIRTIQGTKKETKP